MQDNKKEMIDALNRFKQSYLDITRLWDSSVNLDVLTNNESYPFDKSFDELEVVDWVCEMTSQLQEADLND